MFTSKSRAAALRVGILLVLAAVSTPGCAALEGVLSNRPTLKLAGAHIDDISLDAATLVFDVDISNPYPVALPLVNLDYALASRGTKFLDGAADMQGTVPAGSSRTVALPVKLPYRELLTALGGVRPGDVVPYDATLGLSVDAPGAGRLRLPIERSGDLPVPAAPGVTVEKIAWEKLGLDQAVGRAVIGLENHNRFAMALSKMDYALSLAGVQVADSALEQTTNLAASGGRGTVEIPLRFSPVQLGRGVWNVLTGQGADVTLGGDLTVTTPYGPMTLPLSHTGRVPFTR